MNKDAMNKEAVNKIKMNKKGEEYVEAAIVLPLLILVMLSMIMMAVFLFTHQVDQTKAQAAVMSEAAKSDKIFGVVRKSASTSENIKGLYARIVSKNDSYRAYAISQADAVLLGELAS